MTTTTTSTGTPRLTWDVPEIAAVAVLAVVAILALTGLVTGIVVSTDAQGPTLRAAVGSTIALGAAWSGPVTAILLLGALGACWWQRESWTDAAEYGDEATVVEASAHVSRSRLLSQWTQAAFVLVMAGTIALFVGAILENSPFAQGLSADFWGRDVLAAGELLATLLVTTIGLVVARVTWPSE